MEFNLETAKMVNFSSTARSFNNALSNEFGTRIMVNFTAQPVAFIACGAYTPINSTPLSAMSTYKEYQKTGKVKSHERMLPVFITIDYNVINRYNLEADELMGIILHEIGHNIRHIPIFDSLNLIDLFVSGPVFGTVLGGADQLLAVIAGVPVINQVLKFRNLFTNLFANLTGGRLNMLDTFNKLVLQDGYTISTLFNPIRHIGGYQNERYSDSLATAYGYGSGLSRGLLKIHATTNQTIFNKVVRSNKLTSFGDVFLMTFIDIVSMISMRSVHPKVGHRIKNSLAKLERDLKDGSYPPEVKRELESDVKELRKIYEDYLNASDFKKDECLQFYRKYIERYGTNPLRNILLSEFYQNLEV